MAIVESILYPCCLVHQESAASENPLMVFSEPGSVMILRAVLQFEG